MKSKLILFSLSLLTSLSVLADAGTCQKKVLRQINLQGAQVSALKMEWQGGAFETYSLRTNYYGGDAMQEVIVRTKDCKVIANELVWSE